MGQITRIPSRASARRWEYSVKFTMAPSPYAELMVDANILSHNMTFIKAVVPRAFRSVLFSRALDKGHKRSLRQARNNCTPIAKRVDLAWRVTDETRTTHVEAAVPSEYAARVALAWERAIEECGLVKLGGPRGGKRKKLASYLSSASH